MCIDRDSGGRKRGDKCKRRVFWGEELIYVKVL